MAEESEGRWITINGTHIFVKNGQSPMDALIRKKATENQNTKFNKDNFFTLSKTKFKKVENTEIENKIKNDPDFESDSGSKYLYTEDGVYRYSDHWGGVASCIWEIDKQTGEKTLGFSKWENFKEMKDISITVTSNNKEELLKVKDIKNIEKVNGVLNDFYIGELKNYYKYINDKYIEINGKRTKASRNYMMQINLD